MPNVKTPILLKNKWIILLLFPVIVFFLFDLLFPFQAQLSYSKTIYDRNGKVLQSFLNKGQKWRLQLELNEVNPMLETAFLAKEDQWFYYHIGFNPFSIVRAAGQNILKNRRTSGASTITMQVVRLLRPQERSYLHKIQEIFNAIQLELHYSKAEILALYFNLVPYGSNIEGVKSASILYFQKNPDRLSLAEIATLTIIPNRPSSLRIGQNNSKIVAERNRLLQKYKAKGLFSSQLIETALAEPFVAQRHTIPKIAPHFCQKINKEIDENNIVTSLDASRQHTAQEITQKYSQRLAALNVRNAAVLVVDNRTKQVLAYVGSQNFNDHENAGQVDGVQAVRSPGSTLKPLLYGLAFDRGIATPKSAILDVPINFDGYQPENFDQDFHGKVSYEYALANSLNIPAVKILDEIGAGNMIEALKKCQFRAISQKSKELGLSLILGGCGVSLEELTVLFSAFGTQGVYSPIQYQKSKAKQQNIRILSPEANYLVTSILAQIARPDLPNNFNYTYRLPKIAWKTGTSFGKKDAWSIGYNANYTVGVWLGNFDGTGIPEMSGANMATPLLFEIFNAIAYNQPQQWAQEPQQLKTRNICTESGDIPSAFCSSFGIDYYMPATSHNRPCTHLKQIFCSHKLKISYCTSCQPAQTDTVLLPNIAPELLAYYQSKKISYTRAYPHNPACSRIFNEQNLKVTFPTEGAQYYINTSENQQLSLSVQASAEIEKVYWYANDKFLGQRKPTENMLFSPKPGQNLVFCLDDKSRSHKVSFKVKYVE
jgi:penicillin-binding protein 1C